MIGNRRRKIFFWLIFIFYTWIFYFYHWNSWNKYDLTFTIFFKIITGLNLLNIFSQFSVSFTFSSLAWQYCIKNCHISSMRAKTGWQRLPSFQNPVFSLQYRWLSINLFNHCNLCSSSSLFPAHGGFKLFLLRYPFAPSSGHEVNGETLED